MYEPLTAGQKRTVTSEGSEAMGKMNLVEVAIRLLKEKPSSAQTSSRMFRIYDKVGSIRSNRRKHQ